MSACQLNVPSRYSLYQKGDRTILTIFCCCISILRLFSLIMRLSSARLRFSSSYFGRFCFLLSTHTHTFNISSLNTILLLTPSASKSNKQTDVISQTTSNTSNCRRKTIKTKKRSQWAAVCVHCATFTKLAFRLLFVVVVFVVVVKDSLEEFKLLLLSMCILYTYFAQKRCLYVTNIVLGDLIWIIKKCFVGLFFW